MPESGDTQRTYHNPLAGCGGIAAAMFCLVADPAAASFGGGGYLELGFGLAFAAAGVLALPGALLCLLAEWRGARRRPPLLLGVVALGLASYCLWRVGSWKPGIGDTGIAIFVLPPLMTLALVTLVPAPRWRLIAVWCVAVGSLSLVLFKAQEFGSSKNTSEGIGALLGGALVSMLLWQLAFLLGQRSLRRAGIAPAPAPDLQRMLERMADGLKQANENHPEWVDRLAQHQGFLWWLGGAAAFYVGVGVLTAVGYKVLLLATLQSEWRIADFLGFATRGGLESLTFDAWALHGLVWSAIAGWGTWGAAAAAGRFDAGRLAPFRLTAILLATGMLLWLAHAASAARF
jgi:hypothetical protein